MHWYFLDAVTTQASAQWLFPFAARAGRNFHVVPAHYDVGTLIGAQTTGALWRQYLAHSHRAWRMAEAGPKPYGFITTFPPLAMTTALHKHLRRSRAPVVAWNFNMGALYGGLKGFIARQLAVGIDSHIVHSAAEIDRYARWLRLPRNRFHFVPLQRPTEPVLLGEDEQAPFLLAMGSARRDYGLLCRVAAELGIPTTIVAAPYAVEGIALPPNVTVVRGLTRDQCDELTQRARLCIVPVLNDETASGQVTLITSMMYGRATIATRCIGSEDYVEDRVDGWLIAPQSEDEMRNAIARLWGDAQTRRAMGAAGRHRVSTELNDARTGERLDAILQQLEDSRSSPRFSLSLPSLQTPH
jgi:Glycosyl transferases group 1